MLDTSASNQTQAVLDDLNAALAQGDPAAVARLFTDDSFWRDLVSVTWNLKTVEGPGGVEDMLKSQLDHVKLRDFKLQDGEIPAEEGGVITAWINFETATGRGEGLMRIRDGKIWTLLTALYEAERLRGAERPRPSAWRQARRGSR